MLKRLRSKLEQLPLILKIFNATVPPYLYYKIGFNSIKNLMHFYAPSSAIIGLTYRCQCECVHCSASFYKKEVLEELTTSEVRDILRQIDEVGVPRINFTGGEALMRNDIFDIIAYASRSFVTVLESNGQLLNEDTVLRLKRAGLSCAAVSLDSHIPEVHDDLRKLHGCFAQAIKGIICCVQNKLPCLVSTYVPRERVTREYIEKLMALAKKLKVLAVRIMPPRPVGSFSCHIDSLLDEQHEKKLLGLIDRRLAYFKGLPAPKQCGIYCRATFYVSPYGEIQLCPYLPFSFGTIRKEPLLTILNHMWGHDLFKRQGRDCLILNKEFRDGLLNSNLSMPKEEGAIFPVKV